MKELEDEAIADVTEVVNSFNLAIEHVKKIKEFVGLEDDQDTELTSFIMGLVVKQATAVEKLHDLSEGCIEWWALEVKGEHAMSIDLYAVELGDYTYPVTTVAELVHSERATAHYNLKEGK